MLALKVRTTLTALHRRRHLCTATFNLNKAATSNRYEVVVVGGGAGGCTMAAKLSRRLGAGKVAIIEPNDVHYYQPLWTLVGGGVKDFSASARPMRDVLPRSATWIRDRAIAFDPANNRLTTANAGQIHYDQLIVSAGIQLDYHVVKGLNEALDTPGVCSNYSPSHVTKTFPAIKNARESGNAIFTFPNTPVKCAGAPQKIMYLAEDYWRKEGKRSGKEVIYVTSAAAMFGVKKYATALEKIVRERNIRVYFRHHLVEVRPDTREAVFQSLDQPDSQLILPYSMLHVTPPMSPPDVLKKSPLAVAAEGGGGGWVDVDKFSLQHSVFPNVFALGDCSSAPTSKTAAAVAAQSGVVYRNVLELRAKGRVGESKYDGYTSCPLVTGYGRCILAEFDYDGRPLETLPVDGGVERRSAYIMKSRLMPPLYWQLMLRGWWEGPKWVRRAVRLGMTSRAPDA